MSLTLQYFVDRSLVRGEISKKLMVRKSTLTTFHPLTSNSTSGCFCQLVCSIHIQLCATKYGVISLATSQGLYMVTLVHTSCQMDSYICLIKTDIGTQIARICWAFCYWLVS